MKLKIKQKRNRSSKPRFNLEPPTGYTAKSKVPNLIYLVYRYKTDPQNSAKRVRLKYSTGIKLYRKNFDQKMQRSKAGVRFTEDEAKTINDKLRALYDEAISIVKTKPNISQDYFKTELDYFTGEKKRPKTRADFTLLEYFRLFINRSTLSERSILKFETEYNHFANYEKDRNDGKSILFDEVNSELSEKIAKYLYSENELSQNSASKSIQILKQVVRDAHENGYHKNTLYQSRKFGISRIQTSKQFLELDELDKLGRSKKIKLDRHIRTRILWLIGAFSGLRISDLHQLKLERHFETYNDVQVINLNTFKGLTTKDDTQVVIPVLPQLKELLESINYKIPKAYSSQKMNEYIKEVCELAELDREVENKKSVSGKIKIEYVPLHTQITNHSARYTFINIMLNDYDIPTIELKKITGQILKTLEGYERGDKKKNAAKVYAKTIKAMRINEQTKMQVI